MKKVNKNKGLTLRNSRGFTLIEILVVIGIIAILAAIVIIAINPAKQFAQARNTQRESNINAILNAIGQRVADNKGIFEGEFEIGGVSYECGEIPADLTNIFANNPTDQDGDAGDLGCLIPTYISALPEEPTENGSPYTVELLENGRIQVCAPEMDEEESLPDLPEGAECVTR